MQAKTYVPQRNEKPAEVKEKYDSGVGSSQLALQVGKEVSMLFLSKLRCSSSDGCREHQELWGKNDLPD